MPSNKILEQKKQVVADLADSIKNSAAGVLVKYQGITVEDDTKMRKALREAGVKYVVMKNTLTGKACEENGLGDMKQYLNGMTAIAVGTADDPIAPAKILSEFSKSKKKMAIKCGVCDGAFLDEAGVQALANLPSKEVLIAKIMGSMMSSVSKFVYCVEALRKKQAGEE